jgi:hypothetical protein
MGLGQSHAGTFSQLQKDGTEKLTDLAMEHVPFLDDSPIEHGHFFFHRKLINHQRVPIYPHRSWRNPHQILEFILSESDLLVNLPELLKRRSSLSELFAS